MPKSVPRSDSKTVRNPQRRSSAALPVKKSLPSNKKSLQVAGNSQYSAPALDKGIDILELLCDAQSSLTMAEIAQKLGRSISEIFRMMVTLQRRGWVLLDAGDRYQLSTWMFELAHRSRPISSLTEAAIPELQNVARQAMQSCHLSILENGRVLVIASVKSPGNVAFSVRTGSVIGLLNTASGHVLLAYKTAEQRQRMLDAHQMVPGEAELTHSDWQKAVDKVALDGYACSASQQVRGVTNIAYPIFDRAGDVVAAIVMPYLKNIDVLRGMDAEDARLLLANAAATISRAMGYQPSPLLKTAAR